jgi:ectoine hydroxylase-related dioxygenase (phytanoyl-CoA dioxygenase family)
MNDDGKCFVWGDDSDFLDERDNPSRRRLVHGMPLAPGHQFFDLSIMLRKRIELLKWRRDTLNALAAASVVLMTVFDMQGADA